MLRRLQFVTSILGATSLVACNPERFDEPICRAPDRSLADHQAAFAHGYFPPQFGKPSENCGYPVGPVPIIGEIEREWFPSQLQAAYEPSFFELAQCKSPPEFALRFSYIPSFDPSVFIRVQSDGDGLILIAKELNGAGGYEPGTLARSKKARLSQEQAAQLMRMLDTEKLFEERPATCDSGFDGSEWIFELVDKDGYRMVKRWSPDKGAAHDLGRFLIELSALRVNTY